MMVRAWFSLQRQRTHSHDSIVPTLHRHGDPSATAGVVNQEIFRRYLIAGIAVVIVMAGP